MWRGLDYYSVFEFLRRSHRHREAWSPTRDSVSYRMGWVWSLPEPMRAGFSDILYADLTNTYIASAGDVGVDWSARCCWHCPRRWTWTPASG